MPQKIKIGFIGAGTVGQMHISHWSKLPVCEVAALAELRPELRRLVANKFNIPRSYDRHLELIKNPEIEAVVVVTRRHDTAAVVHDCISAGKHVFSEKPMANTSDQAQKLAHAAQNRGLLYGVGYQRRHDAGTQIAKKTFDQLIRTGELGQMVLVRSWNFTGQDRRADENYVMTPEVRPENLTEQQVPKWLPTQHERDYDRFLNVCCHDVNILRYFLGRNPEVKFADLHNKQGWIVVFDFGGFLSDFYGNINELNDGGMPGPWNEGLEIFFEMGRLKIKFSPPLAHDLCTKVELQRHGADKEILCSGEGKAAAFQLQAEHFLERMLQKQGVLSDGMDALHDLQMIESIWKHYLRLA